MKKIMMRTFLLFLLISVSANPAIEPAFAYESSSRDSVKKEVDNAVGKMRLPYYEFSKTGKSPGKEPVMASTVQKKIDEAMNAKRKAQQMLDGYHGEDKEKLQNLLNENQKYIDNAQQYIWARWAGNDLLNQYHWNVAVFNAERGALFKIVDQGKKKKDYGDIRDINNLYFDFDDEIQEARRKIDAVWGADNRAALNNFFTEPAYQKIAARLKHAAWAVHYIEKAEWWLDHPDEDNTYLVHAKKQLNTAKGYIEKQNTSPILASLVNVYYEGINKRLNSYQQFVPATISRIQDIHEQWRKLRPTYYGSIFEQKPSVQPPYNLGKIRSEALQDALNTTNFVRFLAYLPSDVTLKPEFNQEAQAASVVNAANRMISHYPGKPVGMQESLFELGSDGARTSNLGLGYSNIQQSIQRGYMSDSDQRNIASVGHRRWVLSPLLEEVGFGFAYDTNNRGHTAMKVFSDGMWQRPETSHASYGFIAWPSKTAFPTSFFYENDAWSVSLNSLIFDTLKTENISVELTRIKDRKIWRFSKDRKEDGYFNIDPGSGEYMPDAIIFQPKQEDGYHHGDEFRVKIEGLYTVTGEKTTIQYGTTFFDMLR